jgi:hypothetical protein
MRAESTTGLYWSIRGAVLCQAHIADVHDDGWHDDGWAALPESSQGSHGRRYQCQRCASDGRAFASTYSNGFARSA